MLEALWAPDGALKNDLEAACPCPADVNFCLHKSACCPTMGFQAPTWRKPWVREGVRLPPGKFRKLCRFATAGEPEFVTFVLSKQGQEIVIKDGYFPLPADVADEGRASLKYYSAE